MLELIRKHVLKNIADYGKANPGSVIGKVIAEKPEVKNDIKSAMAAINEEIKRASSLSKEELEEEMKHFTYAEKVQEEKLVKLPNAIEGKVVTRFPPEPSGYPHIGHAKAAWLDYEGARNHGGYMVLRIDDTNPEKEKQEYVDSIKEGLIWLGIKWEKETYTTDHMDEIYSAAKKLIENGKAYVTTAAQEDVRNSRTGGKQVPCRENSVEENLSRWEKMLNGSYKKGEATLLFKGDLKANNTTLRDPTLARIIETPHFKAKDRYRVWPSYDLAVVVMDRTEGITHSMRSKEYELRDELYREICKALNHTIPELVGFSRLSIKNAPISKRLITPLVEQKNVDGWDDPRLPTLAGLRRRGILPEAIREFVLQFGLSKVESEPDWEALLAINRKMLDPVSPHYFFVRDPVKITTDLEKSTIELKKHPKADMGMRTISTGSEVYLDSGDFGQLEDGEVFRLKDFCNIMISGKTGKKAGDGKIRKKIQWVTDPVECTILVPKDLLKDGEFDPDSLQVLRGVCEKSVSGLEEGTIVQFERFGFCRLDSLHPLTFVYSC